MKLSCAQLWPRIGELDGNRRRAASAVSAAAADGAALIVLPELCVSGYVFRDAGEARELAEPIDGPTVEGWREQSVREEIAIVGGVCELDDDGLIRNSAVLIEAGELLAVYRKLHLWDQEKLVFTPGDDPPPVVETSLARVGVGICYDSQFPEAMRMLALAGAEVIAVPTNNPVVGPELAPLPGELLLASTTAMVNRVYVAQADRTGLERGVQWVGATAIAAPTGRLLTDRVRGEGLVSADIDPALARDKQLGEHNDALSDRRPELYGAIAAPLPALD
ncbi:MAG: carbon-nitrogen hydrolase [Actinomycetota bacterium]|nr:carbon-nitrogen hydrolase [Actinomycetota bacterium]